MFQLAKGAGFLPNFREISDDDAHGMLTTLMELVRMIRDGDPNSLDERAEKMYRDLDQGI